MRSVWYCCPIERNGMCGHISPNLINHKFHENWLSGPRVVTSVRTHRADASSSKTRPEEDRRTGRHFLSQTSVGKLWNFHTKIFQNRTIGVHKYSYVCWLCHFLAPSASSGARISPFLHTSDLRHTARSLRVGGVTVTPYNLTLYGSAADYSGRAV
jgi:hypothetical protein